VTRPLDTGDLAPVAAGGLTEAYAAEHDGVGPTAPLVSVVLPTKEEAGNVELVAARLNAILPDVPLEVIFVDDSDDDTPAAIRRIESARPVRLLHRSPAERTGGLGGAVVAGIRAARGEWVCVMDADLQHPPEVIDDMLAQARATASEVVVASRFCPGGKVGPFRRVRKALSRVSSRAALTLFPSLRHVTDPMSGFFLVRRDALDLDGLQPQGFKILLEILVRTQGLRVSEVPFEFGKRHAGQTKASLREGLRYGSQLWHLQIGKIASRFGRFGVVGLTGLVVNTLVLAALAGPLGMNYILAVVLATQGSTLWNFLLTEAWVFPDRKHRRSWIKRITMFALMNDAALVLRIPIVLALTSGLGAHYLVSNLISLLALTVIRFAVADTVIWGKAQRRELAGYSYDIHGIVTITSDVRLPELARFRVDEVLLNPAIRVCTAESGAAIAKPKARLNGSLNGAEHDTNGNGNGNGSGYAENGLAHLQNGLVLNGNGNGNGHAPVENGALHTNGNGNGNGAVHLNGHGAVGERTLRYLEGRRGLGFGIEIKVVGERIEVLAAPLLERSPHVLYTNVVEPILRWLFASKGYALVHGACFADGESAMMVTARTDTGKTTTALKLLDRYPYSFLSDDLTILCPDGRVLAYPKPLTISRHTLHAVNSPLLSLRERVALIVQSRIHSRSGRRFAFVIASLRIPAATINAIVQRVVPPPKYQIDRLIPTARIAPEAQLTRLVVIERDHDRTEVLRTEEAVATLMSNCEDAFGFPPYSHIEEFLQSLDGTDLKSTERAVITSALSEVPASVLGSSTMDWARRLAPSR
jgi:dolichol-phosphate mannosyltransferase